MNQNQYSFIDIKHEVYYMINMVQNKKEIQSACDQAKDEVYNTPITIDH